MVSDVFEPGQFVACYQLYACGTLVKGWVPGIIIERFDYYDITGYLVLEHGETQPTRYDSEWLEDYEKFMERQNKSKIQSCEL